MSNKNGVSQRNTCFLKDTASSTMKRHSLLRTKPSSRYGVTQDFEMFLSFDLNTHNFLFNNYHLENGK